jgi:hypothetical protein
LRSIRTQLCQMTKYMWSIRSLEWEGSKGDMGWTTQRYWTMSLSKLTKTAMTTWTISCTRTLNRHKACKLCKRKSPIKRIADRLYRRHSLMQFLKGLLRRK